MQALRQQQQVPQQQQQQPQGPADANSDSDSDGGINGETARDDRYLPTLRTQGLVEFYLPSLTHFLADL